MEAATKRVERMYTGIVGVVALGLCSTLGAQSWTSPPRFDGVDAQSWTSPPRFAKADAPTTSRHFGCYPEGRFGELVDGADGLVDRIDHESCFALDNDLGQGAETCGYQRRAARLRFDSHEPERFAPVDRE